MNLEKTLTITLDSYLLLFKEPNNETYKKTVNSVITNLKKTFERSEVTGGVAQLIIDLINFLELLCDNQTIHVDNSIAKLKIMVDKYGKIDYIKDLETRLKVIDNLGLIDIMNNIGKYMQMEKIKSLSTRLSIISRENEEMTQDELNELLNINKNITETIERTMIRKDDDLMGSVMIGQGMETEDLDATINEVLKSDDDSDAMLKFGWKSFNKMVGGGIKTGEYMSLIAPKHSYKTSLVSTLFAQLALCNEPKTRKDGKKPALVYYVMEDDLREIIKFLYLYLKTYEKDANDESMGKVFDHFEKMKNEDRELKKKFTEKITNNAIF